MADDLHKATIIAELILARDAASAEAAPFLQRVIEEQTQTLATGSGGVCEKQIVSREPVDELTDDLTDEPVEQS